MSRYGTAILFVFFVCLKSAQAQSVVSYHWQLAKERDSLLKIVATKGAAESALFSVKINHLQESIDSLSKRGQYFNNNKIPLPNTELITEVTTDSNDRVITTKTTIKPKPWYGKRTYVKPVTVKDTNVVVLSLEREALKDSLALVLHYDGAISGEKCDCKDNGGAVPRPERAECGCNGTDNFSLCCIIDFLLSKTFAQLLALIMTFLPWLWDFLLKIISRLSGDEGNDYPGKSSKFDWLHILSVLSGSVFFTTVLGDIVFGAVAIFICVSVCALVLLYLVIQYVKYMDGEGHYATLKLASILGVASQSKFKYVAVKVTNRWYADLKHKLRGSTEQNVKLFEEQISATKDFLTFVKKNTPEITEKNTNPADYNIASWMESIGDELSTFIHKDETLHYIERRQDYEIQKKHLIERIDYMIERLR